MNVGSIQSCLLGRSRPAWERAVLLLPAYRILPLAIAGEEKASSPPQAGLDVDQAAISV
ncbi:MAG: hypothetical protein ACLGRW_06460 [Acidobacteriota bacterium]